jgi:hypothetical protein
MYTSEIKICTLICVSNLVWILKWLFKTQKYKRICGTVINFANLPLKTNLYNLIRHSQSKICLIKMVFEHPRSIFKKLWQNSSQGERGGRECETIVTPSFKKCGSESIIHGSGFGFKPSLKKCGSGSIIHGSGFGFKNADLKKISYLFPPLIL